jgi:hypothetical protein
MHTEMDSFSRRSRLAAKPAGKRVSPTVRDLHWFAALAEHGPLPSSFLLAFTKDSHASEKRARERLTDLFHEDNTPNGGAYLMRPPQQFRTLDSRYNQLVYDLTPASKKALHKAGLSIDGPSSPSGPWLHRFMVSCITASVELATLDDPDVSYIPQSAILARVGCDLRFPVTSIDPVTNRNHAKDLIPDAVFGLEYRTEAGSRFRFFAVEADRATEPATSSNFNRKSFMRSLLQYEAYVAGAAYRQHLSLTAPLLVLTISSDPLRTARMIDLTAKLYPSGNAYMLFRSWEDFGPVFRPPPPNPALLMGNWARGGVGTFLIDRV